MAGETTDSLARALARVIPGAELERQTLFTRPRVELLLLRDTAACARLDSDTMTRVMESPLYWMFCWASGRVLADYILRNPSLVRERRVVDFGCGSGVVAIAAALAGAREVIACDLDSLALEATEHNAALNTASLTLTDDFESIAGDIDLILAADVLYDAANLSRLQRFIERAGEVLVADSRLRDFSFAHYERVAAFESGAMPDLDESREFNRVTLYRGRAPGSRGLPSSG